MPIVVARSKRYKEDIKKVSDKVLPIDQAVDIVKSFKATKFDQTVELIVSLGIDAKQADQMIRGSLSLPHGVGKTKRVVAFCPDHLAEQAKAAGAIRAGGQELVQAIEKESFSDFDVAIATPDMMRFVGRLGKILGPKGLMPSPKAGTVTNDLDTAINEADRIWLMTDTGICEGAPEDLMLSGMLAKAFESPLLTFSQTGGTFSFVREKLAPIALEGTGIVRKLTERALRRCGYRIEQDATLKVTVNETAGDTEWIIINGLNKEHYTSLYNLINHLPAEVLD